MTGIRRLPLAPGSPWVPIVQLANQNKGRSNHLRVEAPDTYSHRSHD
jgi:hypothetical protein